LPSSRLTIVQLVPSLESGGVERGTLEVAAELVKRDHRSIVISAGGRLVEKLTAQGSEHITWPIGKKSPFTLRLIRKLRRFLVEEKVSIVHARSRVPAWVGYLAWRKMDAATRPRFVTTVHGLHTPNRFSAIMTYGERVIAVSRTIEQYIRENYPQTPVEKVKLIFRGVEPEEFPYGFKPSSTWLDQWRRQYPQLIGKPVITLPGRITRLKGHTTFIEVMAKLAQEGSVAQGLIVGGEGENRKGYAAQLRRNIAQRNLTNITFAGHRSDIREIYAASTLILSLTTQSESFGRTVLEPLCMGVPVIGYGRGGVGEILRAVFAQGLIPADDFLALHARVNLLLETPCVPSPQQMFTLQAMLDQTMAVYTELMNEQGGSD